MGPLCTRERGESRANKGARACQRRERRARSALFPSRSFVVGTVMSLDNKVGSKGKHLPRVRRRTRALRYAMSRQLGTWWTLPNPSVHRCSRCSCLCRRDLSRYPRRHPRWERLCLARLPSRDALHARPFLPPPQHLFPLPLPLLPEARDGIVLQGTRVSGASRASRVRRELNQSSQ